jgi:protein-S-isoprenylcysteine O-methyltransferase Ste14
MSGAIDFEARADRANRLGYRLLGVAVVFWWAGMKWVPGVYEVFAFPGVSREQLFWFGLPDLVVLGGGALWAGSRIPGHRLAGAAVMGGYLYAMLWCVSAGVRTGGGWFGTMLMCWAVMLNLLLLGRQDLFRVCADKRTGWIAVKTFLQSAGIWGLCLGVFPWVIVVTFGGKPETIVWRVVLGGALFAAGSALGVRSAVEMVKRGKGTPLPTDAAVELVTGGPYGRVRNPMAVAGLIQALGVAAGLGSVAVSVYVLAGGVVWHFFVRPEEELFLSRRFGGPYHQYVKEIRCWIPKS